MKKIYILLILAFAACSTASKEETKIDENPAPIANETAIPIAIGTRIPEWAKSANIYEVNVRQYTPSGTLNAFAEDLPRLQKMGVDILWIMPVQPIGVLNRKETPEDNGSYYSIQNYTAVNPDLGTIKDFKKLVEKAHKLGMFVLLDWVANHTAWDHVWVAEHPNWYTADSLGNRPIVPIDNEGNPTDWTDVADLNYENADMRNAMINDMRFWLTETKIDGFRCDVAGFVPNDFWQQAYPKLKELKPDIFMLAEWEDPAHMETFNMNYGWHLHHIMNEVAKGDTSAKAFEVYAKIQDSLYGSDDIRMFFTTNHDENSWNGTVQERFGDAAETYFVLAATFGKGMPLIYSGQEMGLDHRLSFFGKDTIPWAHPEKVEFYKKMLALKHYNPALWNGNYGGEMQIAETDNENVLVYIHESGENRVIVFLNFSDQSQAFHYKGTGNFSGYYQDWFRERESTVESLAQEGQMVLEPFEYKIYVLNPLNE